MQLTIKTNFPQVQAQLDRLQKDVGELALARAITRTLEQGRTQVVRSITSEFNVKAKDVRETLRIQAASRKGGSFRIEGFLESRSKRGRATNLIRFGAVQTKQGVRVKIKRGGPSKVIKGAFIANKGNSAGGTVFQRVGKDQLPIKAIQTIGVQQMFNAKRVKEVVVKLLETKFPEVFEREARFYIERFNRGRG